MIRFKDLLDAVYENNPEARFGVVGRSMIVLRKIYIKGSSANLVNHILSIRYLWL